MVELGRGGLERKFADEGDFWSELAAGVCGEGLRLWWGLGLKLRWSEMVVYWWFAGRNLGEFRGQWSWEFLKEGGWVLMEADGGI